MGFFDNLRAKRAAHRDEWEKYRIPVEASNYLIGNMQYHFFRSHINHSGTDLIYDEDDCLMGAPYNVYLKRLIKLMHSVRATCRQDASSTWSGNDLRCDYRDITPYIDADGVRHHNIYVFCVRDRLSDAFGSIAHYHVIRSEVLQLYKDLTTWRFSAFESDNKSLSLEKVMVSNFYIQHTNSGTREWSYGIATPKIWERIEDIRDLVDDRKLTTRYA